MTFRYKLKKNPLFSLCLNRIKIPKKCAKKFDILIYELLFNQDRLDLCRTLNLTLNYNFAHANNIEGPKNTLSIVLLPCVLYFVIFIRNLITKWSKVETSSKYFTKFVKIFPSFMYPNNVQALKKESPWNTYCNDSHTIFIVS